MSDQNQDTPQSQAGNEAQASNSGAETFQKELEEQKALAEKSKNDYLYLRAEFENYKRNAIKERSDLIKYSSERLIVDVLNVVDNFERALQTPPNSENLSTYAKGIEMTATELKNVLNKFGVSEVNSEKMAFDPMAHEALASEETAEVPEGHVFRVFKKAYKLHDKLIRPAQVVVAKKPSAQ